MLEFIENRVEYQKNIQETLKRIEDEFYLNDWSKEDKQALVHLCWGVLQDGALLGLKYAILDRYTPEFNNLCALSHVYERYNVMEN